jgi:hypothetical protein
MRQQPKYSLEEVYEKIRQKKYWFSAMSRSIDQVIKAYGKVKNQEVIEEAEGFILDGILKLNEQNFYKRVIQWDDLSCIADVYGIILDGKPWFVKFRIDFEENLLEEISFHPPEAEFTTVGGIRIPAGGQSYEK